MTTISAEGKPNAQYGADGSISAKKIYPVSSVPSAGTVGKREQLSRQCEVLGHTDQIHDVNTSDDLADNDIAQDADEGGWEDADHGEDRSITLVVLVVELHPVHPAGEATPVDAGDDLHGHFAAM